MCGTEELNHKGHEGTPRDFTHRDGMNKVQVLSSMLQRLKSRADRRLSPASPWLPKNRPKQLLSRHYSWENIEEHGGEPDNNCSNQCYPCSSMVNFSFLPLRPLRLKEFCFSGSGDYFSCSICSNAASSIFLIDKCFCSQRSRSRRAAALSACGAS